jgi:GMP synthase (glutamine-hydrolysing)
LLAEAIDIARSEARIHQAFVYNERVIWLQFHLESTEEGVESLIQDCSGELANSGYIQAPSQLKAHTTAFRIINGAMDKLLSRIEQVVKQTS